MVNSTLSIFNVIDIYDTDLPTKHALQGFTETLHDELNPAWNIKVSSILCGGFVTDFASYLKPYPQPAAYAEGSPAVALVRNILVRSTAENQKKHGFGDPVKGVQKMWELSKLENPPLRLLLGKNINTHAKQYLAQLTKEVDEYESWSDHLGFEA